MPDFSRWGGNGGDPSLNAIGRTDRYLDALASEQAVYATDPADAELANLMAGWRDGVRRPPIGHVARPQDAEIVLQRVLAGRRRGRMSMAVLGSVAASLLCLGGFGAVVYGAAPGDALYGLRVSLFGERQVTRDDKVALAAQTEMQQVQQLIDQGNWTEAQDKLQTITSTVQTVEDPQKQQQLQDQLNQLSVKVETRDPNATVPAAPAEQAPPNIAPIPVPPSEPQSVSPGQLPFPLPQLPGPGVPPDISLPSIPLPRPLPLPDVSNPLPIPLPDGSKPVPLPGGPKPVPIPDGPKPIPIPNPDQGDQSPASVPKPIPAPNPALAPNPAPIPAPAPNPAPVEPLAPDVPVQQAPPALAPVPVPAPAPVPAPVEGPTTPLFPIPLPVEKPAKPAG